jgi:hypothetical protein
MTEIPSTPVEGCECGCNDTPAELEARREACHANAQTGVTMDALEMIRAQVKAYEEADSLTDEQQESLDQARQVLATVEEMTRQGHKINLKLL